MNKRSFLIVALGALSFVGVANAMMRTRGRMRGKFQRAAQMVEYTFNGGLGQFNLANSHDKLSILKGAIEHNSGIAVADQVIMFGNEEVTTNRELIQLLRSHFREVLPLRVNP